MQSRIEASVMTSLSELRAIAQQRVSDEQAARERARAAAIEEQARQEQARRDAEDARIKADREERIRVEEARAAAEREARLRVEAHEASERARHAAELEQRRLAEEIELRRAEVAKKRPRWMIAVTALALVATVAFGAYAANRAHEAEEAARAAKVADDARMQALADMRESRARVETAQRELDTMSAKIDAALKQVSDAQDTIALREAQAHLKAVQLAKAEAQRRLEELKAAQLKKERAAGIHTNCTDKVICN